MALLGVLGCRGECPWQQQKNDGKP